MAGSCSLGRLLMPSLRGCFAMRKTVLFALLVTVGFTLADAANEVIIKPLKPVKELKCYKCLDYESHCVKPANMSVVGVATCLPEETFCQVKRLHLNEDLLTFERGCSSTCKPGCEKAGDYKRCTSCCINHLCNIDNSAPGITGVKWITCLFIIACLSFLRLH